MPREVTIKAGMDGLERELTVQVHDSDAEPWGRDAALRLVGGEHPRPDGPAKATGAAKYAYDAAPPRMAFAASLLSPHAHAKVTSLDVAAARAVPGVLSVKPFDREIKHAGQGVALVCAETEAAVADALRALKPVYEVLPAAVTVEQAMADGAPAVEPGQPNKVQNAQRGRQRNGDDGGAQKAFDGAAVKVQAEFRTQIQTHSALEPHGSVSDPGTAGDATVWASTQATGSYLGFAQPLGVEAGRVRVLSDHVGGGFGAKFGPQPGERQAAQLARELGRPVRYMQTRREEHLIGGNRPDSIQRMALGGTKDGEIQAFLAESHGTAGNGQGGAGSANTIIYRLGAVEKSEFTVRTFTERGAAFRAPGHPQGVFALEGILEHYAHTIGMDPLEVRKKNDRHPLRALQWALGAERIGWAKNRRKVPGSDKGPVKRGLGCAAGRWGQAGGGAWVVEIVIARDGLVTVRNAVQDIGTGTKSVLQILVAEELGCELARVNVTIGDTRHPPGPGSGGSTTAPSMGPVAREAALRAREQLEGLLAVEWNTEPSKVGRKDGRFTGPGGKKATFAEACGLIGEQGLRASGTRRPNWNAADGLGETAGCQFAQVAVDVEMGVIRVEKVVAVHDAGRIVNALSARNQVNGGVIQGVSYALFEERLLDRAQGDMVNPTFDTYRIAGMQDCPEIEVILTSVVSGFNNVGMMGLGEPATVPTAAAVASAVFNATGVQVRALPMNPARVLAALSAAGSVK
jgi:xanthine dehydrogenase YagR molybdenum-binding subunit